MFDNDKETILDLDKEQDSGIFCLFEGVKAVLNLLNK